MVQWNQRINTITCGGGLVKNQRTLLAGFDVALSTKPEWPVAESLKIAAVGQRKAERGRPFAITRLDDFTLALRTNGKDKHIS